MNRILTAAVLTALVSMTAAVSAAGDEAKKSNTLQEQLWETTPGVVNGAVLPVDLEAASGQYDVTLPEPPVRMTADSMVMRSTDGYVAGRGNVDLQRGMDELHAHVVEGNTKQGIYYTPGQAVYISGDSAIVATGITYNGKNSGAVMRSAEGLVSPEYYIRGTDMEMVDGVGYMKHGLITTPHAVAKTPDYYLTGDDIRIYPGEKFTAENTKLWFKHICLLTYGHYEGKLGDNASKSVLFTLFPRPTFNSDDGIGLKGHGSFSLNDSGNTKLNVSYALTSKEGFRPKAQIEKNTSIGSFRFGYSQEESTDNDDNVWATKWPELEYSMPRIRFGSTGLYADGSANWGRWSEDGLETGSHRGYRVELSHDPLRLWNMANVRFYTGYRRDLYSTENAQRRDPYWGVVFNQGINDRMWTSFWYKKHNIDGYSPYRFDTFDHPHQKGVSIGYVLTPLDTFIFTFSKDMDSHTVSDRNYTWVRDMHSFIGVFTYKQDEKSWEVKLTAKDLDF